jgi:hypothetical protein
VSSAEQKIIDLSAKVIATQDTSEFEAAVRGLREAIHAHLFGMRDKVADLALLIANESESNAAD